MAVDYLNVYDMNRQKSAVLQNAFDITETQELNKIYTLDFKIPADDVKCQFLQPFHYCRFGDTGELYRIIKTEQEDSDTPILSVNCEHVIATLVDDLMFGAYQYGGGTVKTADVIRWLLSKQKTANWVLAECDFVHRYEYNWEQENILNALYSIPKEFTKAYKWTFDTSGYPWRLSLKAIDATIHPEYYIRAKRNLLSSGTGQDFAGICTRIYPLGYGEGVNQLTIKDVNNGVAYLQSPAEIVAQYGIKERVLVDRRFEDAESLKSYAQTMLDGLQTPSMSRSFDVVDLYPLMSQDIDSAEVGKICKMTGDDTIAYVTKTVRVLDQAGNLKIDLSTKATDVASAIADLADRVRIESVYAQGATQLYQHSKDANATKTKGMIMSLYFPSEMRQINKVLLHMKLEKFRSYSQTTDAGGASTQTSSSGGGSNQTSSAGGASSPTSSSGGGSEQTSSAGGSSNPTSSAGGSSNPTSSSGGGSNQTSSAGGATGSTSVASGGGGISLNPSVSVNVGNTGDANWTNESSIPTSKTDINDYENYGTQVTLVASGSHSHTVSGSTNEVTPAASADYKHYHSFNSEMASTSEEGSHLHTVSDNTGHSHGIAKGKLQHNHPVNATVSVNVNNSERGQTGFSHSHTFSISAHTHTVSIPSHTHTVSIPSHTHTVSIGTHTHTVSIPSHTHTVSIGAHTHTVDIPAHTHTVDIPSHTHNIAAGIFESGNASKFDIYIGTTKKATINAKSYDGDITQWLLNNKNQVPRDTWIDVEIRPNDLAYVQCSVFVQGFVQSRGGGNY